MSQETPNHEASSGRKKLRLKTQVIYVLFVILSIYAAVHMVWLKVHMGKYYRGEGIPNDSCITVNHRTFSFDYTYESGKRGNICSEDGTVLLTDIYIYDLYWYPSKVKSKDSTLFMQKADSLIQLFYSINPQNSIEYYTTSIKDYYPEFCRRLAIAKEHERSSDKKLQEQGRIEREKLNNEKVQILVSNINNPKRWVRQRQIDAIDTLFAQWQGEKRFRGGCQKDSRFVRRQLSGGFPSSVLGKVSSTISRNGTDSMVFNNGIEGYYDSLLAGEIIPKRILKVNGKTIRLRENKNIQPRNGKNIITTINTDIQRITKSALERQLMIGNVESGCAIVMEVATGEIKAIVNLDYDKSTGTYVERNDHSSTESFEPGSTFKAVTLVAALETGKIDTGDIVPCEKGQFSLARAFEISDNEGLYEAARVTYGNIHAFTEGVLKMGIHQDLDIEIKNAKRPNFQSRTKTAKDFKNVTHGYSVSVPPIYMLAFYNAIANNGVYVKPRLIKAIIDPNKEYDNKTIIQPIIKQQRICSQRTVNRVKACMEGVVTHGTARRVRDEQYFIQLKDSTITARPLIAGKTGTAYIYDDKLHQYTKMKNSSFIGYFPADAPKYTCLVLARGTSLDAGYISAPVCKEIAEKLITNLNEFDITNQNKSKRLPSCVLGYSQDLMTIYEELGIKANYKHPGDYATVSTPGANKVEFNAATGNGKNKWPSVYGGNAKDAVYILEKQGYKTIVKGRGKVNKVSFDGKTAYIYLSNNI